jgi:putative ABC transport system permease protein
MIAELSSLAINRVRANPLRSALTILGVVIGVTAVVALVSIGTGVQDDIDDQFSSLGAQTFSVQPGGQSGSAGAAFQGPVGGASSQNLPTLSPSTTTGDPLTSDDVDTVEAVPGVSLAAPVATTGASVATAEASDDATVLATTSALGTVEVWQAAAGSLLPELSDDGSLDVAVLGSALASDLNLDPGEAVGSVVSIDGRSFGVVGVLEEVGLSFVNADSAVVVPLEAAEGPLVDRDTDYSQIRVATEDDPSAVADDVSAALRESRGLSRSEQDDFRVVDPTSIIDTAAQVSGTLTTMTSIIGGVSLVVGAIGIANMMLVAVRERSREIGIRRAVGATRGNVTWQFLLESILLSLIGGLIGIAAGAFLAGVLAVQLLGIPATVSGLAVVGALLVSITVGVIAGIGPAWQAARVDPAVALRYE